MASCHQGRVSSVRRSRQTARLIGFNRPVSGTREWRICVLDLGSCGDWALAHEPPSIDDQVNGSTTGTSYHFVEERSLPDVAMNIWMSLVSPEGHARPAIYIRAGNAPSVVRP